MGVGRYKADTFWMPVTLGARRWNGRFYFGKYSRNWVAARRTGRIVGGSSCRDSDHP